MQSGLSEQAFDLEPRHRRWRPVAPGACSVPGCEGELSCRVLCSCHERSWRRTTLPLEEFITEAGPLAALALCLVPGNTRQSVCPRRLFAFHDNRVRHRDDLRSLSAEELALRTAGERPRTAVLQFSMASLTELVRCELLYALQCRGEVPAPLDPFQVWALISRLRTTSSMRRERR